MQDLPPDLPRLRTLETWLAHTLDRVRQQIAAVEQQEVEQRRGEQARPPDPDWLIEQGLSGRAAVYVHVGGCRMAGKRSRGVERDQALRALAEGVDACTHCRPDSELGFIDG
ncbi:DUF6233 domain-containing protein [Streptomyces mirabilis]|uniref:DUF6233 domain-containing protein n=1 Tax=Streptomyces mirabilis TaxID=68239 RepID=UPI0036BB862E